MPRYLKHLADGCLHIWTPLLAAREDMIEVSDPSMVAPASGETMGISQGLPVESEQVKPEPPKPAKGKIITEKPAKLPDLDA